MTGRSRGNRQVSIPKKRRKKMAKIIVTTDEGQEVDWLHIEKELSGLGAIGVQAWVEQAINVALNIENDTLEDDVIFEDESTMEGWNE